MKTRTKRVRDKKRTTISLSADLLAKGEERARDARRNFSNYIEVLIEADVGLSGQLLSHQKAASR
jgi:hypothetical protein